MLLFTILVDDNGLMNIWEDTLGCFNKILHRF